MDGNVILYVLTAVVAVVISYACMRAIDFGFTKAEDKRRFRLAKGYARFCTNEQKRMAMSITKKLNQNIYDMAKKMGELD